MKKITILINAELNFEFSNYMILSNALLRTNKFKVYLGLIDTISISSNVECNVLKLNKEIKGNDSFEAGSFEKTSLETMNYVWVMSFGKKQAFLDQIQILWVLDKKTKLLNSVESLMFLNNKHWLGQYLDIKHPETFITSDSEFILGLYEENKDDTWILKPTAGSLGKDVFKITQNDCNAKSLIQSMTNNKIGQYSIFQKFIPEISNGEKRIIICNDKVICYYLRKSSLNSDFRTNIHQGARSEVCELNEEERKLCVYIGKEFAKLGAYFIGVDLVFPYVVEVNVLNPGGLNTVLSLTGIDYSDSLIKEIFQCI